MPAARSDLGCRSSPTPVGFAMHRLDMAWEILGRITGRRPGWVIAGWLATTLAVVLAAPDLTRLLDESRP